MKTTIVRDAERCGIMERFEEMGGTLNGAKAVVLGRTEPFALVATLDGSGLRIEYAWPTLRRMVREGRVALRS